jgi:hypothetical protein
VRFGGLRKANTERLKRDFKFGCYFAAILLLPLWFIAESTIDVFKRSRILQDGVSVSAKVLVSDYKALTSGRGARFCGIVYSFEAFGKSFNGAAGGCKLVDDYPVGSDVEILYDKTDPGYSFKRGEGKWGPAQPFLLGFGILSFLFFGSFTLIMVVPTGSELARRKRRNTHLARKKAA